MSLCSPNITGISSSFVMYRLPERKCYEKKQYLLRFAYFSVEDLNFLAIIADYRVTSIAPVVELVDAPDSKSGSFGSAGSSPAGGTIFC